MTTNYNPEVTMEDLGDDDAHLWLATATWNGISAEFSSRDRFLAPRKALELLREKVDKLVPLRTPDTDHDFAEVE